MARRKKKSALFNILLIILLLVLGFIAFKAYDAYRTNESDNFIKEEKEKIKEVEKKKEETKKEDNKKEETKQDDQKPSNDEKTENQNEVSRKGGNIKLDIKGEDEITVKKGNKFTDPGYTATYEDGTDASSEVKVEGEVDTNTKGTYTISYSAGNNIILRRVYVE